MIDRPRTELERSGVHGGPRVLLWLVPTVPVTLLLVSWSIFGLPRPGAAVIVTLAVIPATCIIGMLVHAAKWTHSLKARVRNADRLICPYCLYEVGPAFDGVCSECGETYTKAEMQRYWMSRLGSSTVPEELRTPT